MLAGTAFAQTINTYLTNDTINQGDTIVIPVTVDNFVDVASISLTLTYDPAIVTYLGPQNVDPMIQATGSFIPGGNPPQVKVGWYTLYPVTLGGTGTGTIVELVFVAHSAGHCPLVWDVVTQGLCEYSDFAGNSLPATFHNGSITALSLARGTNPRLFLQSAWAGSNNMNTTLNNLGYLPLAQPYNVAPWNYAGTEVLDSIPPGMVDWILVELRDMTNGSTIIQRRAAILMNDGRVLDTDGNEEVAFDSTGMYYVAIDHRNHMPLMSANPLSIPDTTPFDFTVATNLYGGAASAYQLTPGVYGMITGDISKNGILTYSGPGNDRQLISTRLFIETGSTFLTVTTAGYFREDLNMNGIITYSGPNNDPQRISSNLVTLTGATFINITYTSPVPLGVAK